MEGGGGGGTCSVTVSLSDGRGKEGGMKARTMDAHIIIYKSLPWTSVLPELGMGRGASLLIIIIIIYIDHALLRVLGAHMIILT